MNTLLERLAGLSARRHWIFIVAWVIILGGLLAAKSAFGGGYVNNYTVSGSDSAKGLDLLNSTFPQQGGYGGQIVFRAKEGAVSAQETAVNQSVSNVAKLPDVIRTVSPFGSSSTAAVSKDGSIAYASVGWSANPDSLGSSYLDKLNAAVAPARNAGLQVEYGAGAGEIGQKTNDKKSEVIGLACALVLLVIMFGSLLASAIPLVAAIFSVLSGLALLALLANGLTFPTTAPTIATLLGLGVAVDYGLFMVARHREQLDTGMGVVASVRARRGNLRGGDRGGWQHRCHLGVGAVHLRSQLCRGPRAGIGPRCRGHHDCRADVGTGLHGARQGGRSSLDRPYSRSQAGSYRARASDGHHRNHA